jgi:hypothetical protein
VTELHQFVAGAVVVATLALLVAAIWSVVASRRSEGRRDHRFAVDRLVLATIALLVAGGLVGIVIAIAGRGPADPLHLLYGPAAVVTPLVGWWWGGRTRDDSSTAGTSPRRSRRDGWLMVATLVLLGLELRLFMTG